MRVLVGSLIAAALAAVPAAALADIVTITAAGLSTTDGATLITTDTFEYGSPIHVTRANYDQEIVYPAGGLISATLSISQTPGQIYTGPNVTYNLGTGDGSFAATRDATGMAPYYGNNFELTGAAGTIDFDTVVPDSYLPPGAPALPDNLDTPYSYGVFTNMNFNDTDIGFSTLCIPGYGLCGFSGNVQDDIYGFKISVTPDVSAAPEPASWALMLAGLGLVGGALRRRKAALPAAIASASN